MQRFIRSAIAGLALAWLPCSVCCNADQLQRTFDKAVTLYEAGEYRKAESTFAIAARLGDQLAILQLEKLAIKHYMARCQLEMFRLPQAERQYIYCIEQFARILGPTSSPVLDCKGDLGLVYRRMSQWDRAALLYHEVLTAASSKKMRAETASKLGYLLFLQGKHKDARSQLQTSMSDWRPLNGRAAELGRAEAIHGLGFVALRTGSQRESHAYFQSAFDLRTKWLPSDHRSLAKSQEMLGVAKACLGDDQRADELFALANNSLRSGWTKLHVEAAELLHEQGLLLARQEKYREACDTLNISQQIFHGFTQHSLQTLDERGQQTHLAEQRNRLMNAMAALRPAITDPKISRTTFEWVINTKGLAAEVTAQQTLEQKRLEHNPESRSTYQELKAIRQRLAAISVSGDDDPSVVDGLLNEERRLFQRMRMNFGTDGDLRPWTTAAQVLESLDSDEIVIEYFRLDRSSPQISSWLPFEKDRQGGRYLAWVISGQDRRGDCMDLCNTKICESRIEIMQTRLKEAEQDLEFDSKRAEQSMRQAISAIGEDLFVPLQAKMSGHRFCTISPDGPLWLVPWAAMPIAEQKYLIETIDVRYLTSSKRLLAPRPTNRSHGRSAVFADPKFSALLDGGQAPASSRRGKSIETVPRNWQRLKGTYTEAMRCRGDMERAIGESIDVFTGAKASEMQLRQVRSPRVLHLATHGFFQNGDRSSSVSISPMLRSGLVFAGANNRRSGSAAESDGVMTGMEVLELDLRGTELAVLSACDTGLGDISAGDGIRGMRHAFHLAGADHVIATLWSIPDVETSNLMQAFWKSMSSDRNPALALASAQRKTIRDFREFGRSTHPLFWAAMTLTSQSGR